MIKKILIALCTIVVILGIGWGFNQFTQTNDQKGAKEITISVLDMRGGKSKELYKETLFTDATSLDKLLAETKALKVKMSDSEYGVLIHAILDKKQDVNKGPWWVYESKNNKVCKKQGMCPAVNQVKIANKDSFAFHYIDTFE